MNFKYAPEYIYNDINTQLNALKKQSDILHTSINIIDSLCSKYEFVSEKNIDELINSIRNYALIKEACIEKSKVIMDEDENIDVVKDFKSIEELSKRVEQHHKNSINLKDETLYYAYEFLKITSNNIITDGLLQDHKEKIQSIIENVESKFVDIQEITNQLEPYKIALLYITHQITDLTKYAELLNNTFGAILFYNIISGNNISYSLPDIPTQQQDTINEEEPQPISQEELKEEVSSTITETTETSTTEEEPQPVAQEEPKEEVSLTITETIETSTTEEEPQPITQEELKEEISLTITETIETSTTEEEPKVTTEEEKEVPVETTEVSNFNQKLETSVEEKIPTNTTETPTLEEESSVQTTEIPDLKEETPTEETPDLAYEIQNQEMIEDYFEYLADEIDNNYLEDTLSEVSTQRIQENEVVDTVIDYIVSHNFASVSLYLKSYANEYKKVQILYTQFGLAMGDPLISNTNYSMQFNFRVCEELHIWLEVSMLFRQMFTCENKSTERYSLSPYINSTFEGAMESIGEYLPNLNLFQELFQEIDYNADYLISIKLFDERNDIINGIKAEASNKLVNCEQNMHNWNHKVMSDVTKTLFSPSGGQIYALIKAISVGDFSVLSDIKDLCSQFMDNNGHLLTGTALETEVDSYLRTLWLSSAKHFNSDNDINIGYRNKFFNKFNQILTFLYRCVERLEAFDSNIINEHNVNTYRAIKDKFIELLNSEVAILSDKVKEKGVSKFNVAGMTCMVRTFKDILNYIDAKDTKYNYYYCDLLKTGYFVLNDAYLPYLNAEMDKIDGLKVSSRIKSHIQESSKVSTWKEAINRNIKKSNFGNIELIAEYLKDINAYTTDLDELISKVDSNNYSLDEVSKEFNNSLEALSFNECIGNVSIKRGLLSLESNLKELVSENRDYGFYSMALDKFKEFAISICENSYNNKLNDICYSLEPNSMYYNAINKYAESYNYCVVDEYISMNNDSLDFPDESSIISTTQVDSYNSIFSEFIDFCNEYVPKIQEFDGVYIFLQEVYSKHLERVVGEKFGKSYDFTKSDDIIRAWASNQNDTDVAYNILTTIGFGIDEYSTIDDHTFRMVLSNSEKLNSTPYVLPEKVVFLNKIYYISGADRVISNLNITEDTLLILDFPINPEFRDRILENIRKVSNGYRVVLIDRWVILYLTTIPYTKRTTAFKVCSVFNITGGVTTNTNFRGDYIEELTKKNNSVHLLLGRKYYGKTSIIHSAIEKLSKDSNNITILLNGGTTDLTNATEIFNACKELSLKINPFDTWNEFESSVTRYLNKHPNKSMYLYIDDADDYINYCIEDTVERSSIVVLNSLAEKFKDRFNYVLTCDILKRVMDYANRLDIKYLIVKPLNYIECATMFNSLLNGVRVSISNVDIMMTLIAKSFGCPEMVHAISNQIVDTLSKEDNLFHGKYMYELTNDMLVKSLTANDYSSMVKRIYLNSVIGNDEANSSVIPVVYAIIHYFNEHLNTYKCTIQDIQGTLALFDIEENDRLNIQSVLDILATLDIVKRSEQGEYFFTHNSYRYCFGDKDFVFSMLCECIKIFAKDGITQ